MPGNESLLLLYLQKPRFSVLGSQFSVPGSRFLVLGSQFSTTVKHHLSLLVALLVVAACSAAPVDPPTPWSPSPIPASPTADVFTDYWTRSDGAATLGEPVSAPIFLDGMPTKVYRRGLIAVRPDGLTASPCQLVGCTVLLPNSNSCPPHRGAQR